MKMFSIQEHAIPVQDAREKFILVEDSEGVILTAQLMGEHLKIIVPMEHGVFAWRSPESLGLTITRWRPVNDPAPPPPSFEGRLPSRVGMLTPKERDVLGHLIEGKLNKEIAYAMSLSEATVKVYIRQMMKKSGAKSRGALVHYFHHEKPA